MEALNNEVVQSGEYVVDEVEYFNEHLVLKGDSWTFTTSCEWRLSGDDCGVVCCFDPNAQDVLKILASDEIIEVRAQSTQLAVDPVFQFKSGRALEVFSTTSYEPWSFHSRGGNVFIGNT